MSEQAEILDLEQADESTEVDSDPVASTQEASTWLLPFAFAKRHSVLVTTNPEDGGYTLHCLADVDFDIILEVRRLLKAPFAFEVLSLTDFELLLTGRINVTLLKHNK